MLALETRVESNTEEIKKLKHDLDVLTEFTQKVAYVVKRNQERAEDKQENLVLRLENELLKLENRLSSRNRFDSSDADSSQQALPKNKEDLD